ncbi:hypothetical protein COLO4_26110 [Corchorus olitorius]|uniref:Peptidase S8/S53 domain-containing protein n=1 Tax=Corchorus olitorius TaxID=93759 RepID=A0A1R3HYR0_9ROSI|nr:hypothetical protein COLO4_26110 [Corchorus olitorius]
MKSLITFVLVLSCFFSVSLLTETGAAAAEKNGVYIVYMGAAPSKKGALRDDHAQLVSSLLKRNKNALVQSYKHGFSGFAAVLSETEAKSLAKKPGVVSVFPDPVLELHTTRSWDFLKLQTSVVITSNPNSDSDANSTSDSGAIIGILDTGIWPESDSFNDKAMGPIPSRWNGTCTQASDFNTSNCNKKIIGARAYDADDHSPIKFHSARDMVGHGTHVASTAAGSEVQGVSYYGLAAGTAKGGSPGSRIAMYRVCSPHNGCRGSSILAAFDDAIADGVDVLSLSLGAPSFLKPAINADPIALGAFHAVEHGITVVCSAGNDGPDRGTVVNAAPWILTVAASTIDRDFESTIVLGDNTEVKGEGINFADIKKTPIYPIIYAKSAKKSGEDETSARNCDLDSMDQEIVKGKIVVCDNDNQLYALSEKKDEVKKLGGIGIILIDDDSRTVASTFGSFPATVISKKDAPKLFSYINSTKNPVATILATTTPTNYKPAPSIAYFSSRGPSTPDIAAPGVNILAAWMGNDTVEAPEGKDPPLYNVISGTSMACPHVSGIAATVKGKNPTWSPAAIRSAIITTATQTNNMKTLITNEKGEAATPYDFGAGEVSTTGPLQPGLVYETTTIDYLNFLCYHGYNVTTIKTISRTIPDGFTCPKESSIDLISNINYPSIAITNFNEKTGRKVNRTLTNVAGEGKTVYTVTIDAPKGLEVQVVPDKLQFTNNGDKSSYQDQQVLDPVLYKHGFSGFAAVLSAAEAHSLAEQPGVVSLFPDPVLKLHTTRSWDFLKFQSSVLIGSYPNSDSNSTSHDSDVIIGIIDSGIWPESESFNDKAMGPIPSRWKGACEQSKDFNTSHCNKKIIGARSYEVDDLPRTPRDMEGHGTHVASIAAGIEVPGVSYYGMAAGTAKGGSPGSRIATYRVCSLHYGCPGSSILAAFDDAIADGVDVLSVSLGGPSFEEPDFVKDPIALGAFHAVERGITVVCSGGNDGPARGSVVNVAPWILTVAASTIDRHFESKLVLGDNKEIKGEGINIADIQKSPVYPIILAKSAKRRGSTDIETSNCDPDTMDPKLVKGKIVLCDNLDSDYVESERTAEVKKLGGIGIVLIDDALIKVAPNFGTFPGTVISSKDADKPDIAAPGVNILAAWIGNDTVSAPEGKNPPKYNVISGTSMACPHVSGIAAIVKSKNPTWSPSAIRSAIMTTATQTNNLRAPITFANDEAATPHEFGAGEVSLTGPLQPGLIYESTTIDYLNFLCYYGYNISTIKLIAKTLPDRFTCPKESNIHLIPNINYPSIAITQFNEKEGEKITRWEVTRTLTNVAGEDKSIYNVSIDVYSDLYVQVVLDKLQFTRNSDLDVQVVPDKLQFTRNGQKLSYQVSFSSAKLLQNDVFGSITWSNGKYKVRIPFHVH